MKRYLLKLLSFCFLVSIGCGGGDSCRAISAWYFVDNAVVKDTVVVCGAEWQTPEDYYYQDRVAYPME